MHVSLVCISLKAAVVAFQRDIMILIMRHLEADGAVRIEALNRQARATGQRRKNSSGVELNKIFEACPASA